MITSFEGDLGQHLWAILDADAVVQLPTYNKGDPVNPGSYHPTDIDIPSHGKFFEVIMKRQLVDFFQKEVILSSAQHGKGL